MKLFLFFGKHKYKYFIGRNCRAKKMSRKILRDLRDIWATSGRDYLFFRRTRLLMRATLKFLCLLMQNHEEIRPKIAQNF